MLSRSENGIYKGADSLLIMMMMIGKGDWRWLGRKQKSKRRRRKGVEGGQNNGKYIFSRHLLFVCILHRQIIINNLISLLLSSSSN